MNDFLCGFIMNENEIELEHLKLEFEKNKHAQEFELKEKELELRLVEYRKKNLNPGLVAILIAVIGILGTAIGAYLQGINNQKLHERKHDSDIIVKGLNLESNEKRREYLHFAAKLGLFKDPIISQYILNTETFPKGPETSSTKDQIILQFSDSSIQMIVENETAGRKYYTKHLQTPNWVGGNSGVIIGFGYDIGYVNRQSFIMTWKDYINSDNLALLGTATGLKGKDAREFVEDPDVKKIIIPFGDAYEVFTKNTIPRYAEILAKTFPGVEKLPPDAQGALLSLIFNRGSSLAGSRRKEMRDIKTFVETSDLPKIADAILKMRRLWKNNGLDGLVKRRQLEADLVLGADREYSPDELFEYPVAEK